MRSALNTMQKGEQTRKKIIAEAALLFNKKGFEGTSMQDVSAAAGLEKGSLYTHFCSKEELAKAAFDYAVAEMFEASTENLDSTASAIAKLKLHIHNVAAKPPFPGGCPLMNIAKESDEGNAILFDQAQRAMQSWTAFVAQIVKDGQARGEICPSVEPEVFATMTISLLEGACLMARLQNSNLPVRAAQEHLNEYIDTTLAQPSPA